MPGATEARHIDAEGLDRLAPEQALDVILSAQIRAAESVREAILAISAGASLAADRLNQGGRLIYVGAGSSGLMALADGLELPGTFGLARGVVHILLAGGTASLGFLAGDYEDRIDLAEADLANIEINGKDCVICVTASGATPYTVAAARTAKLAGAAVIGIANNPDVPLFSHADVAILLATPPEVVAGSTRLGAGTAQKMALNMLSTLMAIHLGHVHDGYMVNLRADNAKLHDRARRIVSSISGTDLDQAERYLEAADGSVKIAALLAAGADGSDSAGRLLESCNQNLRRALEMARTGS
jgi:N-acetylmuramic acid 6-phosphate etherase